MFKELFSKVRKKADETVLVFENSVELEKWRAKLKENCPDQNTWNKVKFFTKDQVENGVLLAGNTKQLLNLFVIERGKTKIKKAASWIKSKVQKN